jgi:hypothetical protein
VEILSEMRKKNQPKAQKKAKQGGSFKRGARETTIWPLSSLKIKP